MAVGTSDVPETPRAIKVGVGLPQPPEDLGGWLADVAAFDAAGADALWVELPPDTGLDPLAVTAALATLTFRSLLVTALPESSGGPITRTLATIARLSQGRLALLGARAHVAEAIGADEDWPGLEVFRRLDDGGFECTRVGAEPERWERTASPDSREAWQVAIAHAAERGVGGLLVPAAPRLLDILRNPDAWGDRRDLQLAQG
jgi:hypothetical protein